MSPARRATSFDVAKMAGVSRTTVSFVLNRVPGVSISEATRQRVLDAAKSLNYHPDAAGRKLVSGKSSMLGMVLRQSPEQIFADPFLLQVMLGVEQSAAQLGYHVLLKLVDTNDLHGYTRLIHENIVDGIILTGPRQDDAEIVHLYREGVPVTLIGELPGSEIPFVDINSISGAATAVQHLIGLGHRYIGMITNAPLTYISAQQQRRGYEQAMQTAGLEVKEPLICEGNFTPASGFQAMNQLLRLNSQLTAIFVASDVIAVGAMQSVRRAGLRIPDDIAVVGFNDVPAAEYYDPPLTTIRLPAFGLGWAAGERLVRMIQGEGLDQSDYVLNSELIVRRSSSGI